MSNYQLPSDYIDVPTRIADFRAKYPDGRLRQKEVQLVTGFAGKDWIMYTAEAWRSADDPAPAEGTAWEPVPGRTPFTRDSELQNAETAAWGRAIVAALAADTKHGIASSEEVRNRVADREAPSQPAPTRQEAEEFKTWLAEVPTYDKLPPKWGRAKELGMTNEFRERLRELVQEWIDEQDDLAILEGMRSTAKKNKLEEHLDNRIGYIQEMERRVGERGEEIETVTPEVVDGGTA